MKLLEPIWFLTTEWNDTPEDQEQMRRSIDQLEKMGKPYELEKTNWLRIGFWWLHRRYSIIGDLLLLGTGIFTAWLLWWYR